MGIPGPIVKRLSKLFWNNLTRIREFQTSETKKIAKNCYDKRILEIGSYDQKLSLKRYFHRSNKFIQSELEPNKPNFIQVDVTKMQFHDEFDIILCYSVLEHLFEVNKAVENLYNALKKGGICMVSVPFFYPLHMEPNDYWRFTEHGLKELFSKFSKVKVIHKGIVTQIAFAYIVKATK